MKLIEHTRGVELATYEGESHRRGFILVIPRDRAPKTYEVYVEGRLMDTWDSWADAKWALEDELGSARGSS